MPGLFRWDSELFNDNRITDYFPESNVRKLGGIGFVVCSEHAFMDLDRTEHIKRQDFSGAFLCSFQRAESVTAVIGSIHVRISVVINRDSGTPIDRPGAITNYRSMFHDIASIQALTAV